MARRLVVHGARHHVRIQFNAASNDNPPFTMEPQPEKQDNTLRARFNNCNDRLSFGEEDEKEKQDDAKKTLIQTLIDLLRDIARRIAEGTAVVAEALGLMAQLDFLGIKVSGLPLYEQGAPMEAANHTKTAPVRRNMHRGLAMAM